MELADFLRDRSNLILDKAEGRIRHAHLTHYEQAGPNYLRERLSILYDFVLRYIRENRFELIGGHMEKIAGQRYHDGFDLAEIQTAINELEKAVWDKIVEESSPSVYGEYLGVISTVFGAAKDVLSQKYVALAAQMRAPCVDSGELAKGTG